MTIDLPDGKGQKLIYFEKPDIESNNAIKDELTVFAQAINSNTTPAVSIHDGYKALDVAYQIIEKLEINRQNSII